MAARGSTGRVAALLTASSSRTSVTAIFVASATAVSSASRCATQNSHSLRRSAEDGPSTGAFFPLHPAGRHPPRRRESQRSARETGSTRLCSPGADDVRPALRRAISSGGSAPRTAARAAVAAACSAAAMRLLNAFARFRCCAAVVLTSTTFGACLARTALANATASAARSDAAPSHGPPGARAAAAGTWPRMPTSRPPAPRRRAASRAARPPRAARRCPCLLRVTARQKLHLLYPAARAAFSPRRRA